MKITLRRLLTIGVTLVSLSTVNGQSFLTNGLVAYYPFTGNANDAWGTNDGVVNGAILSADRFGQAGSAYQFSDRAWINTKYKTGITTNSRTISLWFKPNEDPYYPAGILIYWGGPQDGNCYGCDNQLIYAPRTADKSILFDGFYAQTSRRISGSLTGAWHHLVFAYDNSRALTNAQFYLNGNALTNFGGYLQWATNLNTIDDNLFINADRRANAGQPGINGFIDDIRLYKRALSAAEVSSLYYFESKKRVSFVKSFTLDFDGLFIGTNYQLQFSSNLVNWSNWGAPFTATSGRYTNAVPHQRVDEWSKLFFRLVP